MPVNTSHPDVVAAIDLGSNSFHMIVARLDESGTLSIIDRLREPVRLGGGLTKKGKLHPAARKRGLESLQRFSQRLRSLPPGTVRLRPEGGSGGHKGIRSITEHLGSQEFARLRIGIGRPPGRMDPAAYVLQDFSAEEEPLLEETLERAVAAIETWLREGIQVAMDRYNQRIAYVIP